MMHFEMPPVPDISLLSVMGVRVGVGLGPPQQFLCHRQHLEARQQVLKQPAGDNSLTQAQRRV